MMTGDVLEEIFVCNGDDGNAGTKPAVMPKASIRWCMCSLAAASSSTKDHQPRNVRHMHHFLSETYQAHKVRAHTKMCNANITSSI